MHTKTIDAYECEKLITGVLAALGAPSAIAKRWAEIQVETSLLGIDTHGIRMLDRYVKHIQGGGIDLSAEAAVLRDEDACVALDARGGLGHIAADRATAVAVDKAKQHGISCVTLRNGNHVGACAIYVRQVAAADCIGICGAASRAGVAPWGGKAALLGINPLAIAAPVENGPPFMIDMATTVVAMGKVTKAGDLGQSIPEGWALDADGNPTTNPKEARGGTLLPIGAHKGYGLAMAMEMLTAVLGGGQSSPDIKSWISQTSDPMNASFTVIAIDIARFLDPQAFRARMRDWAALLTASPRREGVERIYYPGQPEGESYAERSRAGKPIDERTASMLAEVAEQFGLNAPRIDGA